MPVAKQAETAFFAWTDGVTIADRRDRTRNLSLRKHCTDHLHHGTLTPSYVKTHLHSRQPKFLIEWQGVVQRCTADVCG